MKSKKPRPKYVRWTELSEPAKARLLSEGHPSNRPNVNDQSRPANRFAEDGSAWLDYYLLADTFSIPAR